MIIIYLWAFQIRLNIFAVKEINEIQIVCNNSGI